MEAKVTRIRKLVYEEQRESKIQIKRAEYVPPLTLFDVWYQKRRFIFIRLW